MKKSKRTVKQSSPISTKNQKKVSKPCKLIFPVPPTDIYKNVNGRVATIQTEIQTSMKVLRTDGTDIYVEGAEYPKRSFCTPEAIWSANQAKVLFIEAIKYAPYLLFASKEKLLTSYNKIALKAVKPFLLKRIYLTLPARELQDIIFNFLSGLGISYQTAHDFAEIFSFIIDIDSAYRYPVQDLASEITKASLIKQPIRELKRLMFIFQERDQCNITKKFKYIQYVLSALLLVPKYRRVFRQTIEQCNFDNLQYSPADRYWVHMQPGYKYFGKTLEERQILLRKNYKQVPKFYKISK